MARREALIRAIGQDGKTWDECKCGKYSLEWYQDKILEYELNYVRHDICEDTNLCVAHADWARENNIIVEFTFNKEKGNNQEIHEALLGYPNVIREVWNEMYSDEEVDEADKWARIFHDSGEICSGGAIGSGGEEFADKFFAKNPPIDIIQLHRHWAYPGHPENDWILDYVDKGKPVCRNEFFNLNKHDLDTMKFIFRKIFEHGGQGGLYYGFRMDDLWAPCGVDKEGFEYWEMLEFARDLCKELNPFIIDKN